MTGNKNIQKYNKSANKFWNWTGLDVHVIDTDVELRTLSVTIFIIYSGLFTYAAHLSFTTDIHSYDRSLR